MMQDTVANMISRYGSPVTYKTRSGGINDTTLKKSATETSYSVTMQISQFTRRAPMPGLVQDGDLEGRIAAQGLSFTPAKNDKVVRGSDTYTVVNVDKMQVGGQDAVFILVLRGGV